MNFGQDTPVGLFTLKKTGTSPEGLVRRITRHPLESFIRENNPRSRSIRGIGAGDQDNVSKMGNAGGEESRRRFSPLGPCVGFDGAHLRLLCPYNGGQGAGLRLISHGTSIPDPHIGRDLQLSQAQRQQCQG